MATDVISNEPIEPFAGSRRSPALSGTAIIVGSCVCIALIILFSLLAGALGLMADEINRRMIAAVAAALLIPFFVAGFATARWTRAGSALFPYMHGFATWSVTTIILSFAIASQAATLAGPLLAQLGLGAAGAVGTNALLDQLAKNPPRLDTEVRLKEGKAITTLQIGPAATRSISAKAAKAAKKEARGIASVTEPLPEMADTLKSAGQKTGWTGFLSLLGGLVAALAGVWAAGGSRRTSLVQTAA